MTLFDANTESAVRIYSRRPQSVEHRNGICTAKSSSEPCISECFEYSPAGVNRGRNDEVHRPVEREAP